MVSEQSAPTGQAISNEPPFTLEILTDLLVSMWRVEARTDRLPDWDCLRRVFIEDWDGMPSTIRALLHIDRHLHGVYVHEETAMVMAAQRSGILSRINYRMREQFIRLKAREALEAIWETEMTFPAEVEWMHKRIAALRVDIDSGNL